MPITPLWDDNKTVTIRFQYVTVSIMLLCIVVFLMQSSMGDVRLAQFFLDWGVVAHDLTHLEHSTDATQELSTLLSSQFIHADWMHLLGNLLFLWIFGDNIEDLLGHFRFLLFYLLCGLAAAAAETIVTPGSTIPVIGASGAISGVMGAYLLKYPKARLLVLAFFRIPIFLPTYIALGIWFAMQVVMGLLGEVGVAWWAHVGGFIAGMVLISVMSKLESASKASNAAKA